MKKQVFIARAFGRGNFFFSSFLLVSLLSFFSPSALRAQGSYTEASSNPFPTLINGSRMVWGDFDTDGDMDVLYQNSNSSGQAIVYMENIGIGAFINHNADVTGKFTSGPFNGISFTYILFSSIVQYVVDYDNDGDMDIVEQANVAAGRILRNNNGSFAEASSNPFPTLTDASRMLFFDADNDGDTDVLYQSGVSSGAGIAYMENIGIGAFITSNAVSGTFSSGPFTGLTLDIIDPNGNPALYAVDYDNDGDPDLVEQTSNTQGRILVNSNGSYSLAGSNPFPTLTNANRMVFFDADSDGDVDVLYQNGTGIGTGIVFMENIGIGTYFTHNATSGTFTSGPFNGITFMQVTTTSPILFPIDYDSDGDFDLVEQANSTTGRIVKQNGAVPYVTNKVPANQSLSFSPTDNIVLTFSEPVNAGVGNIYIRKVSDNSIVQTISALSASVTGSGTNTITINPPADLNTSTAYYLTFSDGVFYDANNGVFGVADPETRVIEPYTSTSFLSFTTAASLPVVLMDLSAEAHNDKVEVSWKTATETNNSHFIVERSADGKSFEEIGRVAGKQTTSFTQQYAFTDASPLNGMNYYRLTQVDIDGRAEVLGIRSVRMQGTVALKAYPNPAQKKVTLSFKGTLPNKARLQLTNSVGVVVKQIRIPAGAVQYVLPVNDLSTGVYWLRLNTGEQQIVQLLVIER